MVIVKSYITFINNTSFPVISVYSDNKLVVENILKNSSSEKITFDDGSIDLIIKDNREKTFQSLCISLCAQKEYVLIIKNRKSILIIE